MDAPFATVRAVLLAPVIGLLRALRFDPDDVTLVLYEREDATMLVQAIFPVEDVQCHMCGYWCEAPALDNPMLWMSCGTSGKPFVYRKSQVMNVCRPAADDGLHADHAAPVMVCGEDCMNHLRRYVSGVRCNLTTYDVPSDLMRRLLRRNILRERVRRWRACRAARRAISDIVCELRSNPRYRMCKQRLAREFQQLTA